MKHKGMAISDLEKARRDPGAYGCHGTAVEGQMRPARPVRPVPLLSRNLQTPDTNSRTSDFESADGQGPQVATNILGNDEEQPESELLAQARAQADRVAQLRLDADEQKKATAQRKKEDQAAKKQKKAEEQAAAKEAKGAAAKAQPKGKAPLAKKRKHSPDGEAPEAQAPEDEAELSDYERKIKANVISNNQWLKFLDDVSQKNCKILTENCETIQEITTGGLAQDR
jgi:flagellar biosynthesis GTPase FlhF